MQKEDIKYQCNQLVRILFKEAIRCLEDKCNFAAIAMAWAAVDYAIDFELRGGAITHPKTGKQRESYSFKSSDIFAKVKVLYSIYPTMEQCDENIRILYKGLRNPFLHVKVKNLSLEKTNIVSLPVEIYSDDRRRGELPSKPVYEVYIHVENGPKLVLGSMTCHDLVGEKEEPKDFFKEGMLIFAAPKMAQEAIRIARTILNQLAEAVKTYAASLDAML